jgi:PTS system mannose-specific IID component
MQSVGFCFAMLPLARRLSTDGEVLRSFLSRHLRFFNTNPAMAGYVLGAAAAAEARGEVQSVDDIKKGLAGPLGMAGDALLWGAARPFAGLLSVALLQARLTWAPLALLAVYNVPHLYFRIRGVLVGARLGPWGARELRGRGVRLATRALRGAAAFLAGMLVALAARGGGGIEPWRLAARRCPRLLRSGLRSHETADADYTRRDRRRPGRRGAPGPGIERGLV